MRRRTQVAIVGAGPAGLLLANVLIAAGVDCVVVEHRSREHVQTRARAGFLEQRTVDCLRRHGLCAGLDAAAARHVRCEFRSERRSFVVDYGELAGGRAHWVYPQQLLVRDLVQSLVSRGGDVRFSHAVERVEGVDSDAPLLVCRSAAGETLEISCEIVAGCDGARGISCQALAGGGAQAIERRYPFGWLTVLAEADPPPAHIVYAMHADGFAAHVPRTPEVSRFYLQCAAGDTASDWPAERVWAQLRRRLSPHGAAELTPGRILEQGVLAMRSSVTAPMQHGRLYLAGDAAHVLTPCGAKGMNLAIADADALARSLVARLRDGDGEQLDGYGARRLPDVWRSQEFSDWLLHLLHEPLAGTAVDYERRLRAARLEQLEHSPSFAQTFARRYVG
ncbi:MAG: p-hydroxybenzoate 3-monooxygenase [Solirubrobacteraceae bacterium]|nr:p-hydroxybenzoate 3-monooxygenase [Solirubrobacteraceae bacterium]